MSAFEELIASHIACTRAGIQAGREMQQRETTEALDLLEAIMLEKPPGVASADCEKALALLRKHGRLK